MRFFATTHKPEIRSSESRRNNARSRGSASQAALAALALALCVLLSNCGSARPVKYFTIQGTPPAAQQSTSTYPVTIVVGHISAPLLYRDDRMVYSNGSVELGSDSYNRWAEQPTEMIESMMVQNLRATGQFRAVQRMSSSGKGEYILRGRLSAFNEVDNPGITARFTIDFELLQAKTGNVVWVFPYTSDQPVTEKSVTAIVLALQTNVRTGLQQATASLLQYFATHPQQ
jgi:cholesterol transport system auxiliary component